VSPGTDTLKRNNSTGEIGHLYTALQDSSVAAAIVGGILEVRMHQLFKRGYSLSLFTLGHGRITQKNDVYDNYGAPRKEKNPKILRSAV